MQGSLTTFLHMLCGASGIYYSYEQGWAKVTQPIWFTVYFTCECSSSAAMVTRYPSYFITIYNATVRLCNIRQPTKFGTKKNEKNSRVRILGQRCVTFAHPCISVLQNDYWDRKPKSQTVLALYCTKSWWEQVETDNQGLLITLNACNFGISIKIVYSFQRRIILIFNLILLRLKNCQTYLKVCLYMVSERKSVF